MRIIPIALASILLAHAAQADIVVSFIEGAPKDRFVMTGPVEACSETPLEVRIDLAGSAGGLIFDTTGAGAGVEVFQPFDLVKGAELLKTIPTVSDGDQSIALMLSALVPSAEVAFTIDVDDTGGAREITVSDAEIAGASVYVSAGTLQSQATFDDTATAVVEWSGCAS